MIAPSLVGCTRACPCGEQRACRRVHSVRRPVGSVDRTARRTGVRRRRRERTQGSARTPPRWTGWRASRDDATPRGLSPPRTVVVEPTERSHHGPRVAMGRSALSIGGCGETPRSVSAAGEGSAPGRCRARSAVPGVARIVREDSRRPRTALRAGSRCRLDRCQPAPEEAALTPGGRAPTVGAVLPRRPRPLIGPATRPSPAIPQPDALRRLHRSTTRAGRAVRVRRSVTASPLVPRRQHERPRAGPRRRDGPDGARTRSSGSAGERVTRAPTTLERGSRSRRGRR
jgi:hypothetical protein